MLERVVYAIGPGADEIGARAFGVASQGYWTTACVGRLTLGACHESRILACVADSPGDLAVVCRLLDRNKHLFNGWKILAYSSRAPRPYPRWFASARFPILIVEIAEPLNRFQALEKTAHLLAHLRSPSDLIEERIRLSVDP